VTTPYSGWGKPALGAGVLRYPQIMSPNFNLASPLSSPANSWALLQNGLAYLFGVVLSGGTITGPDYIIDTQGIRFYNGTPASGNLVAWFAPGSGTDSFGNAFTEGLNIGGTGQNIALLPLQNSAFNVTTAIAGTLEAIASLGTGDASQVVAGILGSLLLGTATATKETTVLGSPLNSSSAAYILLESENDGSTDTAIITLGTVTSPDSGTTLVYTPVATFTPYAFLLYGASSGTVTVTKTSGSGTIPVPGGVTTAKAECWGSGGGGGNGVDGSAGGGGEYAAEASLAVTGGGTVAYSVGAAGSGGASGTADNPGGNGGNSTLTGSSVTVTAHGGSGSGSPGFGAGGTGSANTTHFDGGAGGIFVNGFNGNGGAGGGSSAGTSSAGNQGFGSTSNTGASGGSAPAGGGAGGSGGNGGAGVNQAGTAGSAPGGGGGAGGFNTTNNNGGTGGSGSHGQVRLTYSSGNPTILLSVAAASGSDQFGTAYPAGLAWNGARAAFAGVITSPSGSGLIAAQAVSSGTDVNSNAFAAGFTGPVSAFQPASSPTVVETWHTATLTNSGDWTTVVALSYKLYPDNTVGLVGELNSTGTIVTNRNLMTLPTGYRPLSNVRLSANYNTSTTTVGAVLLAINSSGVVTTFPSIPASSTLNIECRFRTDL
jgi:hypothetical protein